MSAFTSFTNSFLENFGVASFGAFFRHGRPGREEGLFVHDESTAEYYGEEVADAVGVEVVKVQDCPGAVQEVTVRIARDKSPTVGYQVVRIGEQWTAVSFDEATAEAISRGHRLRAAAAARSMNIWPVDPPPAENPVVAKDVQAYLDALSDIDKKRLVERLVRQSRREIRRSQ